MISIDFATAMDNAFSNAIFQISQTFLSIILYFYKTSVVKINFDSILRDKRACIATVGRNHKGDILFAWTESIEDQDPVVAEAKVALMAVEKSASFSQKKKHVIFKGMPIM